MSTPREALTLARQAWNAGDLDAYLELYDDDIRLHGYSLRPMDKLGVRAYYEALFRAFDSPRLDFHDVLWEVQACAVRYTMTGRHVGEFMGIQPTSNDVVVPGITIMRFVGGRVVERFSQADGLGLLMQLGVMPEAVDNPAPNDHPSGTAAPSTPPAAAGSGRYLLGDSPAEIRHLVAQAEVYAEEAGELFDLIGLAPGAAAIDVGCGVMGALHVLVERVGSNGRVVGLDREPRIVQAGRGLAQQRGLPVEFVEADATASGLSPASYDLVHARTLLLNVNNPEEILAEMVRIARPGGIVAVQEPDASAWTCDPPHPAFDILRTEILNAYQRTGKDFNIGRRIARMLRESGLDDVHVRPTTRVTQVGEYYQTFILAIAGLVRDGILAAGEMTNDDFDTHTAALQAHLNTPGTITCQPLMWQAWGQVPS